ncbi:MAG TPA: aspartate kinase [Oscillospiraceae bacterium]|nr:aspartate kinase [Oscillospiraceae bacterium]HPS35563.1 aspartate kinase [Oscillospiraceae bacterium]
MQERHIRVAKFGGTSLADAEQFKKAAQIIAQNPDRRYIVPSAPGKRFGADIKVTDLLLSLAKKETDRMQVLDDIFARYDEIIAGLDITLDLSEKRKDIERALASDIKHPECYVASRGEYLSGLVMSKLLGFEFIDAAEVIFFDEKGNYDPKTTISVLSKRLSGCPYAVIPGFYGAMPDGTVRTFSRGGSDVTGSIVARAAGADLYENWKDVSGFLMADPHIVDHPRTISTITYRELRELAYMGATVMHEDAVFPVRESGIPINIRNTNDPDAPGTMIVAHTDRTDLQNVITGIAGKKGFCIFIIEKEMMNAEIGFGRKVLSVLENNNVSFEHMPSGIDSLCVIVSEKDIEGLEKKIMDEMMITAQPDVIRLERGLALIAVVGRAMKSAIGTAARIFRCIAGEGINVRMIDQGSSELNIIIGVEESSFEPAINAIYRTFVK